MKNYIIPKIWQQFFQFILIQWPFLLFVFYIASRNSHSGPAILHFIGVAIVSFLMTANTWWILVAGGDTNPVRDRFLTALPLSRKQIARDIMAFFVYSYGCFGSIVAVFLGLLLAINAITAMTFLALAFSYLWIVAVGLFFYLVCRPIPSVLARILLMMISYLACLPTAFFFISEENTNRGSLTLFATIILTAFSLSYFFYRSQEKDFLERDLL